jgi:hypothetical protein
VLHIFYLSVIACCALQVTGRVLPLFDSTAALRVLWDGYTEHIQV